MKNLHSFKVTDINGKPFDLADLKGKKVLVVNTASECGFTPQYAQLEELFKKYGSKNFTIVGFPANNFGAQEPGTDKEIAAFCSKNYGVSFLMMSKISVAGKDKAEVYKWLTEKSLNGKKDAEVTWNFQKFMIDEKGNWVDVVKPAESPICDKILNWIDGK